MKGEKVRVDAHSREQTSMKVDVNSYTRTFTPRGKNKGESSEDVKRQKRQALAKATIKAQNAAQRISQKIAAGR